MKLSIVHSSVDLIRRESGTLYSIVGGYLFAVLLIGLLLGLGEGWGVAGRTKCV